MSTVKDELRILDRPGADDDTCVTALRALAVDTVERAGSGHPGAPLGIAPAAYVLWTRIMRHNPSNPAWPDRDRFVLSAGHASALLYGLLHLTGYDLPLGELMRFRRWGSRTPGHPEAGLTPGVETTTGPLGQGFANAVGMAVAEQLLATRFNRPGFEIVRHRTWCLCSDGDLMEGIASEAASLAGHLGLERLCVLYDDNGITIDGKTSLSFGEDVRARFAAYGWHTDAVDDGNDLDAIEAAVRRAMKATGHPSLIAIRTVIGYGSPTKAGSAAAHGAPLGEDDARRTKEALGWPADPPFHVPADVARAYERVAERGLIADGTWRRALKRYAATHPEQADGFREAMDGGLPDGWLEALPRFTAGEEPLATRQASAKVLAALSGLIPTLAGGSADLASSTGATLPDAPAFTRGHAGPVIHFGVREHAMGAIMNGMALHGGVRPFGGTFLVFSDYMRPAIRLAAMMELPVVFVFTHDSIALGEDGPTHQPVEHLAALRAIPGLTVIRPADAAETVGAWRVALERAAPVALCLSRQALPIIGRDPAEVARGATVVAGEDRCDVTLIGTGSEVHACLGARDLLATSGISARVVSMPSWELFAEQASASRNAVLGTAPRIAVEAGSPMGWARWTRDPDAVIGLERFGASAPGKVLQAELGFSADAIAARVATMLRSR